MPIYHYPGYITKEQAAKIWQVQLRTINDWIRKTTPAPATFSFANVDGYIIVKHPVPSVAPPEGISLGALQWVRSFAKRNKIFYDRVYEEIIRGRISGIVLVDRIFVNKNEPQLIEYLANYKRLRKKKIPSGLK